jgi:hypothetical protein
MKIIYVGVAAIALLVLLISSPSYAEMACHAYPSGRIVCSSGSFHPGETMYVWYYPSQAAYEAADREGDVRYGGRYSISGGGGEGAGAGAGAGGGGGGAAGQGGGGAEGGGGGGGEGDGGDGEGGGAGGAGEGEGGVEVDENCPAEGQCNGAPVGGGQSYYDSWAEEMDRRAVQEAASDAMWRATHTPPSFPPPVPPEFAPTINDLMEDVIDGDNGCFGCPDVDLPRFISGNDIFAPSDGPGGGRISSYGENNVSPTTIAGINDVQTAEADKGDPIDIRTGEFTYSQFINKGYHPLIGDA